MPEPKFAPLRFERLRKRPDFLLAAKAPALSRGAVDRNRAKRRLREAARLVLPLHARPSHDYVFIARGGTTAREWGRLLDDVKTALISLAAEYDRGGAKVPKQPSGRSSEAASSQQPDPKVSG